MRKALDVRKTDSGLYKHLQLLQCVFFMLVAQLYADTQKTHPTHRLIGIPEDKRKIKVGNIDIYPLPYFYMQVGVGVARIAGVDGIDSKKSTTGCNDSCIPTSMVGVGFWQQYYIGGWDFGYKIKLTYEVGIKALGENTVAFRSGGGFLQFHLGYKYVLPYASFGYEVLSVGNNFIPSTGETVLHSSSGTAFGIGSSILITRCHALEIEWRISKIYEYKPRLLFMYEFRF